MKIWIVMYDNEIMGAFRNKEDAYNCIVEDFTDSNKPTNEDSPYYFEDMEDFERELKYLNEEYENGYSFGCSDRWRAEETELD